MINSGSTKRILLVNLFSNGDCLYATAIARQIKVDFPGCVLTWAIADFCKNIINLNPFVDHVRIVKDVPKNDLSAFRKLKKSFCREKRDGIWDEVFITQNMDENQALYDGCIRTNILHAYPSPITVDITPVLKLSEIEKTNALRFAEKNQFAKYNFRVLFEFAPQSGQLSITKESAVKVAELLVKSGNVAVILSSASEINHGHPAIIDGSILTLRETAGLTFHCTHLVGCSSGITWAATSDGARQLPMIQLINPETAWINPVSRDFTRFGRSTETIIDLLNPDEEKAAACISESLMDFSVAKRKFSQDIPVKFKTSRKIVYNLLCQLQFGAILKHICVNKKVFGHNPRFYAQVFFAFILFPFTLARNIWKKKINKT